MKGRAPAPEDRSEHRSVYGLIFAIVVYAGVTFMATVGWAAFVDQLILPQVLRQREVAERKQDPMSTPITAESVQKETAIADLPLLSRFFYRIGKTLQEPGWFWSILLLPVAVGIVFEDYVRPVKLKMISYYLVSAALGRVILILAFIAILEVLELVPAGSGG